MRVCVAVLLVVLGGADGCCMSPQWSAGRTNMFHMGTGQLKSSYYHYDSTDGKIAIQHFTFGTDGISVNGKRELFDYNVDKKFTIHANNTCCVESLNGEPMLPRCLAESGIHLGTSNTGYQTSFQLYDIFLATFRNELVTLNLIYPECSPLMIGYNGTGSPDRPATVYYFNDYHPSVVPSVFNMDGC